MSKAYDEYLRKHIENVKRGCKWIFENCDLEKLKEILPDLPAMNANIVNDHDRSKYNGEYEPYDKYFYGPDGIKNPAGPSKEVQEAFNYAWLHHIHNNPHHWQHWLLVNDDEDLGMVALEMPDRDILEMICDWWSFSWTKGDLYELFNWWNEHGDYILLGEKTRNKVMAVMRLILDKVNELGGIVPAEVEE